MPPTTGTQSGSSSGEEWLENIRCPTYFDFEAAVAYPCTLGDDNPPLRESVYDSDDETRTFFRSLYDNPSLHPTLHRRSLSPQRNRLQNMGKPLYRHRPKTTFAEYLEEFRHKQAHQADGNKQSTAALSSTTDSSPTRDLTPQTNISNSEHTPSPAQQSVRRDTRSDACTPQVPSNEKSAPSRRPRRSPASSLSANVEQKATHEQPRPQAQPHPARRKPRLPERNVSQAASSIVANNGRRSKPMIVGSTEGAKREFNSDAVEHRSTHNPGSSEKDDTSRKLGSVIRSDCDQSPTGLETSVAESSAFADVDFVKIMEAHNQRLRKRNSERRSESTNSTSVENERDFSGSQSSEDVRPTTSGNLGPHISAAEEKNCDAIRPDLSESVVRGWTADNDTSSRIRSTILSSTPGESLSELLQMENERILQERRRRLPERRRVLQQNRRNALRNVRASGIGDRRIKPISAQIEFTSAETKRPLGQASDIMQSNANADTEQKQLLDAKQGGNRERGLRGYRSRMDGSKPILSSGAINAVGHRAKITNSCTSGRAKTITDSLPAPKGMKAREADSPALRETEEGPRQASLSKKEACDDLNLLLSEHNNRIRRNRTIPGTINN